MLVYTGTKRSFMEDVDDDLLAEKVEQQVYERLHRKTGASELRAWVNSMQYMQRVLRRSTLPDSCGIAIEYNIPRTALRVDFIVTGYDDDGRAHVEIVELKQWEDAEAIRDMDGIVKTYVGGGTRCVAHPSYQAWSYAAIIESYNESVQQDNILLHPCAYAHNYVVNESCALLEPQYQDYLERAPLFGKHEGSRIAGYLEKDIRAGDDGAILEMVDSGRIRPSKHLQDSLLSMLNGNSEFVMLDGQKVVYETALALARKTQADHIKRVYIVEGGPGTGKSVIAINLLAELVGHKAQLAQ